MWAKKKFNTSLRLDTVPILSSSAVTPPWEYEQTNEKRRNDGQSWILRSPVHTKNERKNQRDREIDKIEQLKRIQRSKTPIKNSNLRSKTMASSNKLKELMMLKVLQYMKKAPASPVSDDKVVNPTPRIERRLTPVEKKRHYLCTNARTALILDFVYPWNENPSGEHKGAKLYSKKLQERKIQFGYNFSNVNKALMI